MRIKGNETKGNCRKRNSLDEYGIHKSRNKHHGLHKSREGCQGHLRPADKDHENHYGYRHSGENGIELLKKEAQILGEQLKHIRQRIKDMEKGKISSELKAVINNELCIGCGKCVEACKQNAIKVNEIAAVDPELCVGCGHCIDRCRQGAICLQQSDSMKIAGMNNRRC